MTLLFVLLCTVTFLRSIVLKYLFVSTRYGSVPANVIMASNSISTKKKLFVLETLTNATNRGKTSAIHLFNPR